MEELNPKASHWAHARVESNVWRHGKYSFFAKEDTPHSTLVMQSPFNTATKKGATLSYDNLKNLKRVRHGTHHIPNPFVTAAPLYVKEDCTTIEDTPPFSPAGAHAASCPALLPYP